MSTFKVFHKGSYYRLSSVPVSLAHLIKVLPKITEEKSCSIYFIPTNDQPRVLSTEEDFKSLLSSGLSETIVYTEMPTNELVDYIDLQKSIMISPDQALTELIRQEIMKQSQVLSSESFLPVHKNSVCSNCSENPIIGIKYSCKTCKIDFCEKCEEISQVHSHPLLKFRNEKQAESESRILSNQIIKKEPNRPRPQPIRVFDSNQNPKPVIQEKRFGNKVFEALKMLKELGFADDRMNKEALECNDYEVESAIDYLLLKQ